MKKPILYLLNILLLATVSTSTFAGDLNLNAQNVASKNAPKMSHSQLVNELAENVQHFAFMSHNLIIAAMKNKSADAILSESNQKIVDKAERTFEQIVQEMRTKIFSNNTQTQQDALNKFGEYILGLCDEFGVRNKFFMKLPAQFEAEMKVEAKLALTKEAINLLETFFEKIKPIPPLHTRIANKLFYNFFSTKVAPKVISFGVGPLLTAIWSAKNLATYSSQIEAHPHNHPLKNYEQIPHKGRADPKAPNFIEKIAGIPPNKKKIFPCLSVKGEGHVCNGNQPPTTVIKQDTPVQMFAKFLLGQEEDEHNNQGPQYEPWSAKCGGTDCDKKCYQYQGYKSFEKIAPTVAWAARPLVLLPAFYLLGKIIEDAQLPEYEIRLKQKEKHEQEKKIREKMKRMKINYEKDIGFAQIKGQKDLIEREMKLIVDYLKNPLRYKNSASGTRSMLLYGPPGTGKTLMARAIAKESGAPFLEVTADDILNDNAKERILATMRLAEEVAAKRPEKSAIIYIDEIDAVTGDRQNGGLDPQRAKALSNLLAIFDGIEKRNPFVHIVILITTNHYKNLDAALLRPGRIDRKILIAQPNADGRREFYNDLLPDEHKHLREWLVAETAGYSGAQIVNIVDTAQMIASYNDRALPSESDYKASLANSKAEQSEIPEAARVS